MIAAVRYAGVSIVLALAAWGSPALADAWTLPQGKHQLITQATLYRTEKFFNRDGDEFTQEPLLKFELNPYYEYGWSDSTTLGANISLQYLTASPAPQPLGEPLDTSDFFGEVTELFVRQRLWQSGPYVIAIQPLIKPPSVFVNEEGEHETSQWDAELALQGGYSFHLGNYESYLSIDLGYRKRFGNPSDRMNADLTLGTYLNPRWLILAQLYNDYTIDMPENPVFTRLDEDDYNLIKGQLSAVYRFNERYALQFGGFHHLHSQNTGGGGGVLLALWVNF